MAVGAGLEKKKDGENGRWGERVIVSSPRKLVNHLVPLRCFLNWVLGTAGKDLNYTQFLNLSEEA